MLAAVAGACPAVDAGDRHVGYYYPEPQSRETYVARTEALAGVDRKQRIMFAAETMNDMMTNSYPPQFALFVKGAHAEKMIITSLYGSGYNTLYRMRGLLAIMTARARSSDLFRRYGVEDVFTFLDLLKLLGFRQITVTDGDRFAHQIRIE